MAEQQKIVIAQLDIDSAALVKSATETKKKIDELKASLPSLKDETGAVTEAYIKQDAQIKTLNAEYTAQRNVIATLTDSTGKLAKVNDQLAVAVGKDIKSISDARKNNSELLKVRNELNLSTKEGAEAAALINQKLNENNKFIKDNVSAYEQQKIGIGDYKTAIVDALTQTGLFGQGIQKMGIDLEFVQGLFAPFSGVLDYFGTQLKGIGSMFTGVAKGADDAGVSISGSADATKKMAEGQKGLTMATNIATAATRLFAIALAATGITLIVAAVALLIGYFRTFTPIVDKVEQAFAGVGAAIKVVQQTIVSVISGINSVGDAVAKLGNFLSDPIGAFKELGNEMATAAEKAAELKKAQQDLEDALEQQEVTSARNRAEINRLNILAKDRTKTEQERIALLQKAEALERKDFEARRANAAEALRIAQQQIIDEAKLTEAEAAELRKRGLGYKEYVEGKTNDTDALFNTLKEAILAETELQNEYYTNIEKNINRQNALLEKQEAEAEAARKKAEEARQKALDDAAKKVKLELDLFIQSQGVRARTLEEDLRLAEEVRDRKLRIAQAEFAASRKTEADRLQLLKNRNDAQLELLRAQQTAAVENAQRELDLFNATNQTLLDGKRFLDEQLLASELDRLNKTAEAQAKFETERYAAGVINAQEYADAIAAIDRKYEEDKAAAEAEREAARAEKEAIDLQNRLEADRVNFENEFAIREQDLEMQRQQELAAAIKSGADIGVINRKYAEQRKKLDADVAQFKLNQEQAIVAGLRGLFSEQSLLGKAFATAEVVMNTVRNATAAFNQAAVFAANPLTAPLAVNAKIQGGIIVATGAAQVAKIAGVKFEKGGFSEIVGPGHEAGGVPIYVGNQYLGEAQGGEGIGILNRGAYAAFMAFNNAFAGRESSSPGFMAGGGIITQAVTPSIGDPAALVELVVSAVEAMPSPVVGVEEIITTAQRVTQIKEDSSF